MNRRNAIKTSAALAGYSLFFGGASIAISSCRQDGSPDWKPLFFDQHQIKLLSEIAERMIPRTESPGAKDVFLERFLDENVSLNFSPEQKEQFVEELKVFDERANTLFNKDFVKLSEDQMDQVLEALFQEAENTGHHQRGTPHITRAIRSMVVFGYFTTEQIAKEVLKYDSVPQNFQGCIDYDQIGGVWAI
ncbi:MAG TPA: gluconate 2-dehydrogenase subunit 3 family protein [Saprospiraceae bacterium]|nr:gluconate 2-dehydrogenase subunit 3 family protein [Saprospiraceae bacterium]